MSRRRRVFLLMGVTVLVASLQFSPPVMLRVSRYYLPTPNLDIHGVVVKTPIPPTLGRSL